MTEYFVYGHYEKCFNSSAIFIPMDKMNSKQKLFIQELSKLNNGLIVSGKKNFTLEQSEAIAWFDRLLYSLTYGQSDKDISDLLNGCKYYYIDDDNKFLLINDLQKKIKSLTRFKKKTNIKVVDCVFIYYYALQTEDCPVYPSIEVDSREKKYILMFHMNNVKIMDNGSYLKDLLEKIDGVIDVKISHDDTNCFEFGGFGYVTFDDYHIFRNYVNKIIIIDGFAFYFYGEAVKFD